MDEAARLINDCNGSDDPVRPLHLVEGACLETALAQLADLPAVRENDATVASVLDVRTMISETRIEWARRGAVDVTACTEEFEALRQALRQNDLGGVDRLGLWIRSDDRPAA